MRTRVDPLCTSLSGGTQSTHRETPSGRIDYLIYARQRKRILGTCLVKACVINTHPPFLILLRYKYRVSKLVGVEYFLDEP
jgi:hypothetical protein